MGALAGIQHVVVLVLENRSFDCMFGTLYPRSAGFEGLSGAETNPYHNAGGNIQQLPVWNDGQMGPATVCIPDPDPGELFQSDMNMQLFGLNGVPSALPPPMSGFVDNYMRQPKDAGGYDPMYVMHYFTPAQVPVISTLAKAFGVSDQWYASAPCQTWPNRFFVHTGTAGGYVDNMPTHFPYAMPTIFGRLGQKGKTWHVYFHDLPQALTLSELWPAAPFHFRSFVEDFEEDARNGRLPHYSFIEPRYFTAKDLGLIPNDEHPPHNVLYGEQLIARVYNAVRSAPTWKQTLLVITYDEHGGCYDHMPPPQAVSPDGKGTIFRFDRYGVRVPAVIVSPYIASGSIVRSAPEGPPHNGPPYPFDHTSIIATVRKLFDLGESLTQRDAVAPDLVGALSLNEPENDGPDSITALPDQPGLDEVAKIAALPPNDMQQSLCTMAAHLPPDADSAGTHTAELASGQLKPSAPTFTNVHEASTYAGILTRSFLGRRDA